ncbi:MAG: MFS transporter, partial [Thalassobaculaceae bacterium]
MAVWWLVFTLPLLRNVKEEAPAPRKPGKSLFREGFGRLWTTFHEIRKLRALFLFL